VWQFNRAWLNQLLFDCARLSLLQLYADPRHLGATPGLLLALHTWGRTLSRHPHVHCLVTAGGLDPAGHWRACKESFLLPLRPLQHLFRGKLLAGLRQALHGQRLKLPPQQDHEHWLDIITPLYRKHFNIQINPPYAHGRAVAMYLARYVKGGPLGANRALDLDAHTVAFSYPDHRDQQRKTLRLQTNEFIARVLWHAPPRGQHTVRHAGLYASAQLRQYHHSQAALRPASQPGPQTAIPCHASTSAAPPAACPICRQPLQRRFVPPTHLDASHQISEFSISSSNQIRPGPTLRSTGHSTAGHATVRRHLHFRAAAC
jgi:Putative transposase